MLSGNLFLFADDTAAVFVGNSWNEVYEPVILELNTINNMI